MEDSKGLTVERLKQMYEPLLRYEIVERPILPDNNIVADSLERRVYVKDMVNFLFFNTMFKTPFDEGVNLAINHIKHCRWKVVAKELDEAQEAFNERWDWIDTLYYAVKAKFPDYVKVQDFSEGLYMGGL